MSTVCVCMPCPKSGRSAFPTPLLGFQSCLPPPPAHWAGPRNDLTWRVRGGSLPLFFVPPAWGALGGAAMGPGRVRARCGWRGFALYAGLCPGAPRRAPSAASAAFAVGEAGGGHVGPPARALVARAALGAALLRRAVARAAGLARGSCLAPRALPPSFAAGTARLALKGGGGGAAQRQRKTMMARRGRVAGGSEAARGCAARQLGFLERAGAASSSALRPQGRITRQQ
jgi:hypothetical protein